MQALLPEVLNPIAWLAGKWTTKEGQVEYPNIPKSEYHEELEFTCIGQPMFNYISTSRNAVNQAPLHQERGFLRIKPNTSEVAFVVSHNSGLTSLEEGLCNEETKEIVLETVNIARMSFSKPPKVTKTKRVIKLVAPDMLKVELFMETDDTPMTPHLKAVYIKAEEI